MKTIRIGTVDTGNGRRASVYCKINLKDKHNNHFSISGVVGPLPSGNALGGCGQIDMGFKHRSSADDDKRYDHLIKPKDINFASGWNTRKWFDFLDVWNKWHLKDAAAVPGTIIEFISSLPDTDQPPPWV